MFKLDLRYIIKKVKVGKDQEKAQSEKDSHSKNHSINTVSHPVHTIHSLSPDCSNAGYGMGHSDNHCSAIEL